MFLFRQRRRANTSPKNLKSLSIKWTDNLLSSEPNSDATNITEDRSPSSCRNFRFTDESDEESLIQLIKSPTLRFEERISVINS